MNCPICDGRRENAFSQEILGRYKGEYVTCKSCGLLQVLDPHWLEEAYSSPIAETDTGLVARNIENARMLSVLLSLCFGRDGRFIDVAGGFGLLARLLRDRGIDCLSTDKYCNNIFSSQLPIDDATLPKALFAFEVLEHLLDPIGFIRENFDRFECRSMVFSTQTFEGAPPKPEWWYYSPETGQHISFYQRRSLEGIAKVLGCHFYNINSGLHILTDVAISGYVLKVLRRPSLFWLVDQMFQVRYRRRSFTWQDHLSAKERLKTASREVPKPFSEQRPSS